MGSLIDDLLEFSRMSRTRLAVRPVELGPLVREVVVDLEADAAGRDVRWSIGELPAVLGDRALLRVVLVNLLGNALKFTRTRPRPEIEVDCRPAEGGDGAVVRVRDNGVGFDPRYADRLFDVFERLHRAEDFEGTGIGLATVRRIVERHGGRTWAEGVPGEGATFCLWLPARPPEGVDADSVETPRPG